MKRNVKIFRDFIESEFGAREFIDNKHGMSENGIIYVDLDQYNLKDFNTFRSYFSEEFTSKSGDVDELMRISLHHLDDSDLESILDMTDGESNIDWINEHYIRVEFIVLEEGRGGNFDYILIDEHMGDEFNNLKERMDDEIVERYFD